jgi:hypothetical protein
VTTVAGLILIVTGIIYMQKNKPRANERQGLHNTRH